MHAQKPLTLFLLFLGGCTLALAQDKPDPTAAVRAAEMKWADSYRARQVDVLSSLLSDDYVITMEDGSVLSKVGFISHTAAPSQHVDAAEMGDLRIRLHGDTAIVTGSYHEKGESGGKPYDFHDRLTDVWMKVDGKWKLVASHYSIPAS